MARTARLVRTRHLVLLATCAVFLACRWGQVRFEFFEYTAAVGVLSIVAAVWRVPTESLSSRVGVVNLIAHLGYWIALFNEHYPPATGGHACGTGIMAMLMLYPVWALIAAGVSKVLAAGASLLAREWRASRPRNDLPTASVR